MSGIIASMTSGAWGVVTGLVVGLASAFLVWLASQRKSDIDESALVLGKWKELVDAHERSLATLNREIDNLRDRLVKAESRISAQDAEILELRTENAGLKRAIAQNSQSTALVLGRSVTAIEGEIAKLDQAGHNRKGEE